MNKYDIKWESNFNTFKEYINKNHKLPDETILTSYGNSLYNWFRCERRKYKNNTLHEERVAKFNSILNGILSMSNYEITGYLFRDVVLEKREYNPDINYLLENGIIDIEFYNNCVNKKIYYLEDILNLSDKSKKEKNDLVLGYARTIKDLPRDGYCYLYCFLVGEEPYVLYTLNRSYFMNYYCMVFKQFCNDYSKILSVGSLTEMKIKVIDSYFGISGNECRNFSEIARYLDRSNDRIRQLFIHAIRKLRFVVKYNEKGEWIYKVSTENEVKEKNTDYFKMSVWDIPYLENHSKTVLWRAGIHSYSELHEYLLKGIDEDIPLVESLLRLKHDCVSTFGITTLVNIVSVAYRVGIEERVFKR